MTNAYYFSPTDRAAASVDEFLATCRALPEVAGEHLASGYFEAWLHDQDRADLAKRAADLRHAPEGLEHFLKAARPRARRAAQAADHGSLPVRRRSRKAA